MAPILYMFYASPPVRAVLMAAKELEIELELKEIDLSAKENLSSEFLRMNPAHTIPTLDDDGFIVFESAAIMGYLVNKYGKNDTLYPKDIKKNATVNQLLHLSTTTFNRLVAVFKPVVMHGKEKSNISQDDKDNLFNAIETLEKLLGTKSYLTGDDLTIADLSFATLISSLKISFPVEMERFSLLTAWLERLEKRPSYSVNQRGLSYLTDFWSSRN